MHYCHNALVLNFALGFNNPKSLPQIFVQLLSSTSIAAAEERGVAWMELVEGSWYCVATHLLLFGLFTS